MKIKKTMCLVLFLAILSGCSTPTVLESNMPLSCKIQNVVFGEGYKIVVTIVNPSSKATNFMIRIKEKSGLERDSDFYIIQSGEFKDIKLSVFSGEFEVSVYEYNANPILSDSKKIKSMVNYKLKDIKFIGERRISYTVINEGDSGFGSVSIGPILFYLVSNKNQEEFIFESYTVGDLILESNYDGEYIITDRMPGPSVNAEIVSIDNEIVTIHNKGGWGQIKYTDGIKSEVIAVSEGEYIKITPEGKKPYVLTIYSLQNSNWILTDYIDIE